MKAQDALKKIKKSITLENFALLMVNLRYDQQFWGDVSFIANKEEQKTKDKPDDYRT